MFELCKEPPAPFIRVYILNQASICKLYFMTGFIMRRIRDNQNYIDITM